MARVLLIDDDLTTLDTLGHIFRLAGHEFVGASGGHDGLRSVQAFRPGVAFIDLDLPDISGIEVLRTLRLMSPSTSCIILTGYRSFDFARDALRAGAHDWMEKPVLEEDLLAAVQKATSSLGPGRLHDLALETIEPHALTRLAEVSVLFVLSRQDAPTLQRLGRDVGHASGCLRNWCRAANVPTRLFRDFTRALRAVWRSQSSPAALDANLLAIVDSRTLKKFRMRSGGTEAGLPTTVEEFLHGQRFIRETEFIAAVRRALDTPQAARATRGLD